MTYLHSEKVIECSVEAPVDACYSPEEFNYEDEQQQNRIQGGQ